MLNNLFFVNLRLRTPLDSSSQLLNTWIRWAIHLGRCIVLLVAATAMVELPFRAVFASIKENRGWSQVLLYPIHATLNAKKLLILHPALRCDICYCWRSLWWCVVPKLQACWLIAHNRFSVQIERGSILTPSGTFVQAFTATYSWAGQILACYDKTLGLKDASVIFLVILCETFLSRCIFWWIIFSHKHMTGDFRVRWDIHERQWNWLWLILHALFICLIYHITRSIPTYVSVVRARAWSLHVKRDRPSASSDSFINLLL